MLFFTEDKIARLLEDIQTTICRETYAIEEFRFAEGDFEGAESPDFDDSDWQAFRVMVYMTQRIHQTLDYLSPAEFEMAA